MEYLLIAFVWLLNFGISAWNAYATGKNWPHTKRMGGFSHFMTWMGFLMSGCGFSWCFLIPLALLAYVNQWLGFSAQHLTVCVNLGYILLAPIIVFAGLLIWIDSLIQAYKERTFSSMAVAGWNTYAQLSNMYDVYQNFGGAFGNVKDFFTSSLDSDDDDPKTKLVILVVVLVLASIVGGFLLTTAIVTKVARNEAKQFKTEMRERIK